MFSRIILIISFILFSSISSIANSKDTLTSNGNTLPLNQTLTNHQNELNRLTKELDNALNKLEKSAASSENQLKSKEALTNANDWITKAKASVETTKSYGNIVNNSDKLIADIEKKLEKPIEYIKPTQISGLSLEALNNANNEIVLDLDTERNHRASLDSQLNQLTDRREKISTETSKHKERLATLKQTKPAQNIKESDPAVLVHNIEQLFTTQKLLELEWEQRSFDLRRDILRSERQLSEKKVLTYEKNASIIQEALNLARTKVATESISTAEKASKKYESAHPIIQEILTANQKMASESVEVSVKITALTTDKQAIEQELEYYRQSFNSIKDKITSAGLSDTIGIRLRNAKNQLPDLSTLSQRIEKHHTEVDQVQLRRIELEDRSLELVDINKEIEKKLSLASLTNETEKLKLEQQLRLLLNEQKNQFLPNILKTYDNYFEKTLIPLIEKEKEYVKLINEYTVYIDERILWVKSSQVFSYQDFVQSFKSLLWLTSPTAWTSVFDSLIEISKNNLFVTVMLFLSFAVTFFIRQKLAIMLKAYGYYKTKLSLAKFSDSLKSGALTLLLAAYWPLILWVIAYGIINSGTTDIFSQAVAQGLVATANVLFFVFLFLHMVRNSGLAESHFRWKETSIKLIKHQLFWFGPLIVPFVFILQTTNNQPIQSHFDGMGRLAFICITILMTILIYRLVNPEKGLFKDEILQHKEGWLNRTRFIWFPLILCSPFILGITAITGYLYTATELMMLLIDSFWVILAAIISRGFLIRWLNIAQRKLAIEQIRKKKISQQPDANTTEQIVPSSDAAPGVVTEEAELDISQISNQTFKLLNNVTGFAIVIGLYLIWADILPALNMLDNISLWQTESTSDGQIVSTAITLGDGLTALAILLITALIGTNIPGLLEIAILQRLPFSPSARYGITTIARYIIIILGAMFTFSAIGIGWSKVQWLAAAITVGLGFGLQEIFANFVSGIIILIERQIRVGDAVTVGTISGRVSKIKMRATTIVDWDKKELIIPNKEFVTGQVVNWTLSDTIIRLVIPVGVAYGSDTYKVHDTLLHIARNNEYIMKEPEPEAFFSGFGESTLDFELRVFLPNSDLRIPTRHELLMQIDQAFREANIEIAFPQRDLHIRSMPANSDLSLKGN